MRDIAEASGLLAGSLYSHFKSKTHILELAILPFYDELLPAQRAALMIEAPGDMRLETMLRRVVEVCARHDAELTILHYDWGNLSGLEELSEIIERSTETLDLWSQAIQIGITDGSLRSVVRAETAMRIITSSIHGVLDRRRYGTRGPVLNSKAVEELANELVGVLIDGLRTNSARPRLPAKRR
jgi:AcrR family transcriptional regulator